MTYRVPLRHDRFQTRGSRRNPNPVHIVIGDDGQRANEVEETCKSVFESATRREMYDGNVSARIRRITRRQTTAPGETLERLSAAEELVVDT